MSVILSTGGGSLYHPGQRSPLYRFPRPRTVKSGQYASYWNAFLFIIFTARKRSCGKVMFLQVCVILFTGGMRGFFRGGMCGFLGGHGFSGGCAWFFWGACMDFSGGCAWFFWGWACMDFSWGACVVFSGGAMRGFFRGGMHGFSGGHVWFFRRGGAWFFRGACVVFSGGYGQ